MRDFFLSFLPNGISKLTMLKNRSHGKSGLSVYNIFVILFTFQIVEETGETKQTFSEAGV